MASYAAPEGEEPAMHAAPEMAEGAPPAPAAICQELVVLQRQRGFCIRMQSRLDRGLEAVLARQIGYGADAHQDLSEAEAKAARKKIFARVAVIRKAVVTEDTLAILELSAVERDAAQRWWPLILQTEASRLGWDKQREEVQAGMRDLARQLPVWEWASEIRGFGPLGLAVIVGEACGPAAPELGDYRSHQNLCKRLGIGVVDGHRQGSPGKGATAEDWIAEGYSRTTRAEVWAFLDDVLRRGQWRNEKIEDGKLITEAGPLGSYGAIYGRQVAEYERRGWPHAKKAAARFMAKALLRDLWRAWRSTPEFIDAAISRAPDKGQGVSAASGSEAGQPGSADAASANCLPPASRSLPGAA